MGIERFIFSMAEYKRDMAFDLKKYSAVLVVHLLFLVYFNRETSYDHWRRESFGLVPHVIVPFKGKHRYPDQDFLDRYLFLWMIDSDAVPKLFQDKVLREGLSMPFNFEETYAVSIGKVGSIIHDVAGILAKDHRLSREQYFGVLSHHGL